MVSAIQSIQYTVRNIQYTVYSMQYTVYSTQYRVFKQYGEQWTEKYEEGRSHSLIQGPNKKFPGFSDSNHTQSSSG